MSNDFEDYYLIKYVVTGFSGVGKSSLAEYYVNRKKAYYGSGITIGVEYFNKRIVRQDKNLNIEIWDTAGQERFNSVVIQYYRNPVGAFLCFSIANRHSFNQLENYLDELKQINKKNVSVILVGTFGDKNKHRTVTHEKIMEFAKEHDLQYMEISSRTGKGVDDCFNAMHKVMCQRIDDKDPFIPIHEILPMQLEKKSSTLNKFFLIQSLRDKIRDSFTPVDGQRNICCKH